MGFPTFQQYQEQYQECNPNFPRNVNQQYIPKTFSAWNGPLRGRLNGSKGKKQGSKKNG